MEDLVLQPLKELDWAASEPPWLAQLRQEVAQLRTEVAQLRRENLELRQQAGYWRSQHAAAKLRIAELEPPRWVRKYRPLGGDRGQLFSL